MDDIEIKSRLERLVERLASAEHERWAHWQRHMHDQGRLLDDGSLILPAELVARWESQIARSYAELSEAEKDSDRDQVRRYMPILVKALTAT